MSNRRGALFDEERFTFDQRVRDLTADPLPVQLLSGYTLEQALVVNVAGAGLVLIVGCGHPGLARMVTFTEQVFKAPLFGLIGGLHFPVTQDRRATGRFKPQKFFGNPNPPWRPITRGSVRRAIRFLQSRAPRLIAVSPHDSCDWTLAAFAAAFGDACQPLQVGHALQITPEPRKKGALRKAPFAVRDARTSDYLA